MATGKGARRATHRLEQRAQRAHAASWGGSAMDKELCASDDGQLVVRDACDGLNAEPGAAGNFRTGSQCIGE